MHNVVLSVMDTSLKWKGINLTSTMCQVPY